MAQTPITGVKSDSLLGGGSWQVDVAVDSCGPRGCLDLWTPTVVTESSCPPMGSGHDCVVLGLSCLELSQRPVCEALLHQKSQRLPQAVLWLEPPGTVIEGL